MIFARNLRSRNFIKSSTARQTQTSEIFVKFSLRVSVSYFCSQFNQDKLFPRIHHFPKSKISTERKKTYIGAVFSDKFFFFPTTFCTSQRHITGNTALSVHREIPYSDSGMHEISLSHPNNACGMLETTYTTATLSNEDQCQLLSARLCLPVASIRYVLEQSRQGATVPFLARYRRDETGQLDEVQLRLILSTAEEVVEVHRRRLFMLRSLKQRGLLTKELQRTLERMVHLSQLEDVWEPFKIRKTSLALRGRDAGLGQFAETLLHQGTVLPGQSSLISRLEDGRRLFVAILAEEIQRCDIIRQKLLRYMQQHAYLTSEVVQQSRRKVVKEMEENKLQQLREKFQYYNGKRWPLYRINSHNVLALERGELQGIIRVDIEAGLGCKCVFEGLLKENFRGIAKLLCSSDSPDACISHKCVSSAHSSFLNNSNMKEEIRLLCEGISTAYNNLLKSIKNTIRRDLKKSADQVAILVFEHNLRYMLLQRPLSRARILAMDPGITNGIKCVALDESGDVISFFKCTLMDEKRMQERIHKIVEEKKLNKILIGNGTASQQTALLVAKTIQERKWNDVEFAIVSEAGASVYSVSDTAKEEFPTLDIMYRGAVNIGRRVLDPLSELVKIPVRSMGIGMYQHDVNEKELLKRLNHVVESCVALVGINASSSNRYVMEKVPGIQKKLVDQIVLSRHTKHLRTREDLRRVPGMTETVYNQVAGFFRFPNSPEPLDNTNIHPESYHLVKQLMELYAKGELGWCAGSSVKHKYQQLGLAVSNLPENALIEVANRLRCGVETLKLVGHELLAPALDPRDTLPHAGFLRRDVKEARDLKNGDLLTGMVLSVTTFGAFVDFGLHDSVLVRGPGVDRLQVGEMIKDLKFVGLDHLGRVQVEQYNLLSKDLNQQKSAHNKDTAYLHLEYADIVISQADTDSDNNTSENVSRGLAAHLMQARQLGKEKDGIDSRLPNRKTNTCKRSRVNTQSEGKVPVPFAVFEANKDTNFPETDDLNADQCDASRGLKRRRMENEAETSDTTLSEFRRDSLQTGLASKFLCDKSTGGDATIISAQNRISLLQPNVNEAFLDKVGDTSTKGPILGKKISTTRRAGGRVSRKKPSSESSKNDLMGRNKMTSTSFGVQSTSTPERDFFML